MCGIVVLAVVIPFCVCVGCKVIKITADNFRLLVINKRQQEMVLLKMKLKSLVMSVMKRQKVNLAENISIAYDEESNRVYIT